MRVPALAAVRRALVRRTQSHPVTQVATPVLLAAALVAGGHLAAGEAAGAGRTLAEPQVRSQRQVAPAVAAPRRPARTSRSQVRRPLWVRPSGAPITSRFGIRWGRMHEGIDFGASYGAPIRAIGDGVVTFAGPQSGYGRLMLVRHADGTVSAYGHMARFAVTGGRVRAGQVIAYVGSAGHSTGPHLHFEIRLGSRPVDPLPWLRAHGVAI